MFTGVGCAYSYVRTYVTMILLSVFIMKSWTIARGIIQPACHVLRRSGLPTLNILHQTFTSSLEEAWLIETLHWPSFINNINGHSFFDIMCLYLGNWYILISRYKSYWQLWLKGKEKNKRETTSEMNEWEYFWNTLYPQGGANDSRPTLLFPQCTKEHASPVSEHIHGNASLLAGCCWFWTHSDFLGRRALLLQSLRGYVLHRNLFLLFFLSLSFVLFVTVKQRQGWRFDVD